MKIKWLYLKDYMKKLAFTEIKLSSNETETENLYILIKNI